MPRRCRPTKSTTPPTQAGAADLRTLPALSTAEQIGDALQVSSRKIHLWAAAETIPIAFRCGKVVRFSPSAVAAALGINLPEFRAKSGEVVSPHQPQNQCPETKHHP